MAQAADSAVWAPTPGAALFWQTLGACAQRRLVTRDFEGENLHMCIHTHTHTLAALIFSKISPLHTPMHCMLVKKITISRNHMKTYWNKDGNIGKEGI